MVMAQGGIVAAEHPLAAQAGAVVLAKGGNAIDAAVAANAVMTVVSPMMCGVGGDLFAIVKPAEGEQLFGLNASGWAPKGLTLESLKREGLSSIPIRGVHSITVPGCVEGWTKLLDRFGSQSFEEVLSPAIQHAEEGFAVAEWIGRYWSGSRGLLSKQSEAAKTFLFDGDVPSVGDLVANPNMAATLKRIAKVGRDGFYRGLTADRIVSLHQSLGGKMTLEDLSEFEAEWVDTISTTYKGWTLHEIPPNGQGIAALMMLNLMEHADLENYEHNSARALHWMIESKKLAYVDMLRFVGDRRFSEVPVESMLSKKYGRQRFGAISSSAANCLPEPGLDVGTTPDTTYLCTVDRDGNMVSLIQSIYYGFGSGLVAEGTGFALQNRGALFSLDPNHPNVIEPRKRPLHTIIPGFLQKGDVNIAFGIMGGWNQSQAHAQFVSNLVDHGMNIQAALEAPRFCKSSFAGCDVSLEARIPESVRRQLEQLGHEIQVEADYASLMGGGQAVMRDEKRALNFGGSDPRKDGAAIPEPISL